MTFFQGRNQQFDRLRLPYDTLKAGSERPPCRPVRAVFLIFAAIFNLQSATGGMLFRARNRQV
jgi:hypothetical protein